ncbi:hypothetical protein OG539_39395 [Actinacidiphila glaucinigra]|uniref:hypothetical protein n=1 Tax=Actinacidiphila glaucinigra TaxID=235986 RepID=UPI003249606B
MTDHARPLELFRFDDEVQRVSVRMEGGPPSGMGDDRYLSDDADLSSARASWLSLSPGRAA